jgi:predicted RNA-binding Zn-ribbon protein involved in translation (DUF1610 family)
MGFIAIYCPRTGREVSTGVESDRDAFQKLRPVVVRMKCPACGSEHVWSKATARLVEVPAAAAAAHGSKVQAPPAPVRNRPVPAAKPVAPPPAPSAGPKGGRTLSIASRFLGQR